MGCNEGWQALPQTVNQPQKQFAGCNERGKPFILFKQSRLCRLKERLASRFLCHFFTVRQCRTGKRCFRCRFTKQTCSVQGVKKAFSTPRGRAARPPLWAFHPAHQDNSSPSSVTRFPSLGRMATVCGAVSSEENTSSAAA